MAEFTQKVPSPRHTPDASTRATSGRTSRPALGGSDPREAYLEALRETVNQSPRVHALAQLQRSLSQSQRLAQFSTLRPTSGVHPVQAKLKIGPANDAYEQEADHVASLVVQRLSPSSHAPLAGKSSATEDPPASSGVTPVSGAVAQCSGEAETAGPETESAIQQARGGGSALPVSVRESMETAFGTDFTSVRVHTDARADSLNQSLSARAFTTGRDIFFGSGEYGPETRQGQELLAHELTHVVQQTGAAQRALSPTVQQHGESDSLRLGRNNGGKGGAKGKKVPAQTPQERAKAMAELASSDAKTAKDEAAPARDLALLKETSAATAEESLETLKKAQTKIDTAAANVQIARTIDAGMANAWGSVAVQAKQWADSAVVGVGKAAGVKRTATTSATEVVKPLSTMSTKARQTADALSRLNTQLTEGRQGLRDVVTAQSASDVEEARKKSEEKATNANKNRAVLNAITLNLTEQLEVIRAKAGAVAPEDVQYEPYALQTQLEQALTTAKQHMETATENVAVFDSMLPHLKRAADQATLVASAKLEALAKQEAAKEAQQNADQLEATAKVAEEAARRLEALVKQAVQVVADADVLVVEARKSVQSSEEALARAQDNLTNLAKAEKGGDAEPYMVEGYRKHYGAEETEASAKKARAESKLNEVSGQKKQADEGLSKSTQEFESAAGTSKREREAADTGQIEAGKAQGVADDKRMEAATKTQSAQQDLAASEQETTHLGILRNLAGGQVPLNVLAAMVPAAAEQEALMRACGYPLVMDCLNAGITTQVVLALGGAFGGGMESFRTTLGNANIVALLGRFSATDIKALHDKASIGAVLKELVAQWTVPTLEAYRDTLTLTGLNDCLAVFTLHGLQALITKLGLGKFDELARVLTPTGLHDFAGALSNEKLLDLTTAYSAAEIGALRNDLGVVNLKELLSGLTAAEVKAYITEATKARLLVWMNTRHLKVDALTFYGAAWLKAWAGATNASFNHLLNFHIKADGVVSGGHDLGTFCNELDRIISAPADPIVRQGRYNPANPGDRTKVTYTTYRPDGSARATGSKTLIQDLATKRVAMLATVNAEIWTAIKASTFPKVGGDAGWATAGYMGFHDGTSISTFYPK